MGSSSPNMGVNHLPCDFEDSGILNRSFSRESTWTSHGLLNSKSLTQYGWWKKVCTSWYGEYPTIYRGLAPSQVVQDLFHQQYQGRFSKIFVLGDLEIQITNVDMGEVVSKVSTETSTAWAWLVVQHLTSSSIGIQRGEPSWYHRFADLHSRLRYFSQTDFLHHPERTKIIYSYSNMEHFPYNKNATT